MEKDLEYTLQHRNVCLGYTPEDISMEHNHGGLEDHFPFNGWFVGCMLIYPSYFRDNSQTHTIPNWIDYSCKVYSESFSAVGPDSPKTEVWLTVSFHINRVELPRTQDASHHQDYEPFLGSSIPTVQPSFVTIASWVGGYRVDQINMVIKNNPNVPLLLR